MCPLSEPWRVRVLAGRASMLYPPAALERASAVVILGDAIFTNQRRQIAELSMKRRLPSVYGVREYAEAGGLMDYSVDPVDLEGRRSEERRVGKECRSGGWRGL